MTWDIPFIIPNIAFLILHGAEFILTLIFSIRLLHSDNYKKVGFALLIFLLTPLIHIAFFLDFIGADITHSVDRLVLLIIIIILGTTRAQRKQAQEADPLSL